MNILTAGTFDIPHYGHLRLLERCKKFGETTVAINTDEFVEQYKGRPPVMSYEHRQRTIIGWGFDTVPNDQKTSLRPLLERFQTDILVIGSDWHQKDYLAQINMTQKHIDSMDISILYVPYTQQISSTKIKEWVKQSS